MATQNVETVGSKLDGTLLILAVCSALGGVLGFSFMSEQVLLVRIGVLAAGLLLGLAFAWFSLSGKQFLAFSRESYDEMRRVVWPSRKETIQTTGIVFVFVLIMALFLFLVDKSIEWALYDLLLRWK